MKTHVRNADLEADRSSVIKLFREHLNAQFDERRFDWLYFQNPCGQAILWILEADAAGPIAGAAAAFPRQMCVGTKETRGYVLGDFCIHPAFRTLGPAGQLQRACLDGIATVSGALWYDFPSDAMTAVYRRLGIKPQSQLVRLAKLLRADRILEKKLRAGPANRLIGVAANSALLARDSLRRRSRELKIDRHQNACGSEFTRLAQQGYKSTGVCVANTAEYLNWRFLSHPNEQFDILTARDNDALVGYLILTREGDDARIVSLRTLDDEHMGTELVLSALDSMRASGVVTVNTSLLASDPLALLFEKLGFRPRESRPVAVSDFSSPSSPGKENAQELWHLMDGDRDS